MAPSKFLCGRLLVYNNGTTKEVKFKDDGGSRLLELTHIDMGFDEIHDKARDRFIPGETRPSKLYDFRQRELDTTQYSSFYDYTQKNGLQFRNTLLYLATQADDDVTILQAPNTQRAVQPVQNPSPVVRRIQQVEADSSTPSATIKTENEPPAINHLSINNHRTSNVQRSSSTDYSFERALNEFVNYLRNLIDRYHHENIIIQLFEHICTIRGLASIVLDRLKREMQSLYEHQYSVYNDELDKVEKISRSITVLIELNKMKISHIDQHSVIINSFNEFQRNFNALHQQWTNNRNPSRHTVNYTVDPVPTTSFASHSSSSRHHSEHHSRRRTHTRSRSPHRSYRRSNDDDDDDERYALFKNVLKSFDHLLNVLRQRRLISFSFTVESLIHDIERCRSGIKLSDDRSLYDTEQFIISMEKRLLNRIQDEYRHASSYGVHPELVSVFDNALESIKHLLRSLAHCRSKIEKHKRPRPTTHQPPSHEEKSSVSKSTQPKPKVKREEDESSETSHSSIGDEELMETARNAYEKMPKSYK